MLIQILIVFLFQIFSFNSDQPEFKGGNKMLSSFIANNLIYPEFSKVNCIQGVVNVSFKLNKRGRIYESKIQKGYGIDLDAEALRVIRLSSGKWIIPKDYDTTSSVVLPVSFNLTGYKCEERSSDQIKEAINAFHARQDLSKAIYNFYAKKANGDYNADDEFQISVLKQQLGYDDKYIARLLKTAQRKLKQGDQESACDDFNEIHLLGSEIADSFIDQYCK
ncbi:MAG: TonB family protein [Daejeonella sp.]